MERCWKCTGTPVRRLRATSRITMISSASAGIPGIPSREDHSPSCMCPPSASESTSQCCARRTSRSEAYSRARRMIPSSCTPLPSSVKSRTPERRHLRHRGQPLPRTAHRDGARHLHSAQRRATQFLHLAHHGRRVDRRVGVGHRNHGTEAAQRSGPAAGLHGLGLLAAGLAEVGVQVDQTGRHDAAAGVERATPQTRPLRQSLADRGDVTVRIDDHVGVPLARGVDDGAAGDRQRRPLSHAGLLRPRPTPRRCPAAGTARPCGPPRRWPPAR